MTGTSVNVSCMLSGCVRQKRHAGVDHAVKQADAMDQIPNAGVCVCVSGS